ncbi:SurA N-terminal domain-containing protein [Salinicoccus sp. CNSTN-B1]
MKKILMALTLGALILALAACGGEESAEDKNNDAKKQEETASKGQEGEQPEMPEPELDDVPDVVAEVNGEEVKKDEFEKTYTAQFQQLAIQQQMAGEEVDQGELKKQIADGMVGQKLLVQEAEERDYKASDEEVDDMLDGLVEQNGMESKEDFYAAVEEQGMSKEEITSQIKTQVKVDKLIAEETGEIKPTEKELQSLYDDAKEQREQMEGAEELPSFEELKPELESQIKSQKESEAVQKLAEKLREDGDITIHL